MAVIKKSKKKINKKIISKKIKKDNSETIKISDKKEVFCGTLHDAEIIDSEYCLFVLGKEKFETITYLRECFYGKDATTGRINKQVIGSYQRGNSWKV